VTHIRLAWRGTDLCVGRRPLPASTAPLAVTALLVSAYLLWRPYAPDLSAQLTRADIVRSAGDVWWWTGWFGGLSVQSYSVLVPATMALIGVRVTAVLAVVVSVGAAVRLTRDCARPRLGAVTVAVASFADMVAGRVTFAVGLALAMWALVFIRERRLLPATLLAVLTFLATPLAGLFLGIALAAVVLSDAERRRAALTSALVLAGMAGAAALVLPSPGTMGSSAHGLVPPAIGCLLVLAVRPPRVIQMAALLTLGALPFFLVLPLAVGSNIDRLAWVCATPAIVATGRLPHRRIVAIAALGTAVWPISDVVMQVRWTPSASTSSSFYQPLVAELTREVGQAGPAAAGQRLEVVDTIDHAASRILAQEMALARGWDRPTDRTANPVFYDSGALNAESYRAWLDRLAVGWVAVPSGRLDYAARGEAALIAKHLGYLRQTWSSKDWALYRVASAQPLATGATVIAVTPSKVLLRVSGPATVDLHLRWSRYLVAVDAATGDAVASCLSEHDGMTRIVLQHAGDVAVTSRFSLNARFRDIDHDCAAGK
jgi:hypothetical protein